MSVIIFGRGETFALGNLRVLIFASADSFLRTFLRGRREDMASTDKKADIPNITRHPFRVDEISHFIIPVPGVHDLKYSG